MYETYEELSKKEEFIAAQKLSWDSRELPVGRCESGWGAEGMELPAPWLSFS